MAGMGTGAGTGPWGGKTVEGMEREVLAIVVIWEWKRCDRSNNFWSFGERNFTQRNPDL